MDELLSFLARHWWLLFILLPWIGSIIGDVFTKAAQKAAEEQRARRRETRTGDRSATLDSERPEPGQPAHAGPRERRPTAEEVAAEIRRMMGMEVQEERRSPSGSRPVVLEEEWEQEPQEAEPQLPEPAAAQPPRETRSLQQQLAERRARQLSAVEARHLRPASARGGLHDRHLETGLMEKLRARASRHAPVSPVALPAGHARRPGELVDLRDPAKAFVMLEVLGPPKALRDQRTWPR